ncbi:MAG: hypothetical protein JWM16_5696, partial [Verrucomicrobiales bacterium]|nr:hypothetical protein [Verrucomicrobiales bacterium]
MTLLRLLSFAANVGRFLLVIARQVH